MAGRKPTISQEDIYNVLLNFEIFENSSLKKKGDKVWSELCNALRDIGAINPVNLYLMLYHDRNNLKTKYMVEKGLKINNIEEISETGDDSEEELPKKKKRRREEFLELGISFEADVWNKIKPVKNKDPNGRDLKVLQVGWTDVFAKTIWKAEKLPCAFNFKRHKVDVGDVYIQIWGYCRECNGELTAKCFVEPEVGEKVTFNIKVTYSSRVPHSGTRKICGPERTAIKKEILSKKPKQWLREKIADEMTMGDGKPPFIYKLGQLRQAKQDAVNEELGIKKGSSLFESLLELKTQPLCASFLKQIGFDPFYVMYWSAEQISISNELQEILDNPVSIDATGSVIKKISRPGGDNHHILLTVVLSNINNTIVPLAQVISERNDTNFLKFWLTDWLKSGAKIPRKITLDRGRALLNAVSLAFNQVSYTDYNDYCLILINNKGSRDKLKTQIKIDIAHLIHCVTRWKCFEKSSSAAKSLFTRCIGYMSTLDRLDYLNRMLQSMMTVAKSKYADKKCQVSQNELIEAIRTFEMQQHTSRNHSTTQDFEEDFIEELNEENSSLMTKFIKNQIDVVDSNLQVNEMDQFLNSNDFYLPDLVEPLLNLTKEFPCWTNIMNKIFENPENVASSARSETYFGQIKDSLLEDRLPIRADKFIAKHCKQINTDMILIKSMIDNFSKSVSLFKKPAEISKEVYNVEEKWRYADRKIEGEENIPMESLPEMKNEEEVFQVSDYQEFSNNIDELTSTVLEDEDKTPKSRGMYVSAEPEITSLLVKAKDIVRTRKTKIKSNLKNGNLLQPVKVFSIKLSIRNTCAFDTTLDIISSAVSNVPVFKDIVNKNRNTSEKNYECFLNTIIQYANDGPVQLTYVRRAYLLSSLHGVKNGTVDCFSSIIDVIDKLLSISSVTEISICQTCNNMLTSTKNSVPLPNINIISIDYSNLEDQLNIYLTDKQQCCTTCTNLSNVTFVLGSYLCIDTDAAYTALPDKCTTLDQLPSSITIKEQRFILCGAARWAPPGHYIAYVRNLQGTWQERNDLVEQRKKLSLAQIRRTKMKIAYLFYVNTNRIPDEIVLQIAQ